MSNDDAVVIGLLRSLLRNGTVESTWHTGSLTFGAEGVRNAIDRIDSLPEGIITVVEQTSVHLFGHEYAIRNWRKAECPIKSASGQQRRSS